MEYITEKIAQLKASVNISSYEDFVMMEAQLTKTYVTPENVKLGVIGLLALAGVFHAIPGPTLRKQSEQMKIPGWFIMCAGLLMIGTAGLCYHDIQYGVIALSACMGGAATTAFKMPKIANRAGGSFFSMMTLAAGIWPYFTTGSELFNKVMIACAVAFIVGVLGRLFVPTKLNFLFAKKEKKEDPPAPPTGIAVPKAPETVSPKSPSAKAKGSAKKRETTPGPKKGSKK